MSNGNTNFGNDTGDGTVGADAFYGRVGSQLDPTLNHPVTATYLRGSVGTGLTAAGTTRANSLVLTKAINNLTTVAASTGVTLPPSATVGIGGVVVIYNNGASAAKVYADGSDTIDATAGATGVTLTNALRCEYRCIAANTFLSAKLGATST